MDRRIQNRSIRGSAVALTSGSDRVPRRARPVVRFRGVVDVQEDGSLSGTCRQRRAARSLEQRRAAIVRCSVRIVKLADGALAQPRDWPVAAGANLATERPAGPGRAKTAFARRVWFASVLQSAPRPSSIGRSTAFALIRLPTARIPSSSRAGRHRMRRRAVSSRGCVRGQNAEASVPSSSQRSARCRWPASARRVDDPALVVVVHRRGTRHATRTSTTRSAR